MEELNKKNGTVVTDTSLVYNGNYQWIEKNKKKYMDIPFNESSYLRMKPWNEAHAYWINKHHRIFKMTKELNEELQIQSREEIDAVYHLKRFEEIETQSGK